ncbi:MAG TPA: PilT/PilU family type 4a pilus ATPase [Vicinamibacteria bacterium]|nr:PilT/PilU family type 4a pilus ATPase [Vicinamibacteria bacterium]
METLSLTPELEPKIFSSLGSCALFRALKPEQLPQLVKVAELQRFEPGETIVRQGDPSDSFYIVIDGTAAVTVKKGDGDPVEIGTIPLPSSVGEVSLLLGEPRTASVTAKSQVQALKFSNKAFDAMFQKIPQFGAALASGLAHRLNQLSGKVEIPQLSQPVAPAQDVLDLLPVELMQRHRILPLRVDQNVLTLGVVDAPTTQVIKAVRDLLPALDIKVVQIQPDFFNEILGGHSGVKGFAAKPAGAPKDAETVGRSPRLEKLLERVVAEGASDLHLSAGHKPHWRIDGDMRGMDDLPVLGSSEVLELLEPVMQPRHKQQFAEDNDTDLAYALPGSARFRVNVFRDRFGVSAVLRQIPTKIMTFEQLSLPGVLKTFCEMPKGLILVTGPTGSGKSTTLAAMIDYINKTKKGHIVTLEDPIEFVHQSQSCLINQREVGGHTRSFGRALRATLREDPDIVLVGEMRDPETIMLALETANTGHLVFGTLHTNNAVSAVDRVVDQFPADQQSQVRSVLGDVLKGVVAQVLVKKKGGGRTAALEVLVVTLAVSNLIRESKTVQLPGIMQTSRAMGMSLLNDELARMIDTHKVDMDEALAATSDKEDLARRFRTGVTLAQDSLSDETFRVASVAPQSPGALAGLGRGDVLVELDGRPTKEFTLDEIRQQIRIDGKRMITVDRGGKRIKLVMELGGRETAVPPAGGAARVPPRRV